MTTSSETSSHDEFERGVLAQGEDDGPGDDGQGCHAESLEATVLAQPFDELDGARRVHREEDAGLGRGGHAAGHGLGHVLLDAA